MLLVSILNMTIHFHLEFTWSSGLKPPWIFGQLCQKLKTKRTPLKDVVLHTMGRKQLIRNRSLSKSYGFTFKKKIIDFF